MVFPTIYQNTLRTVICYSHQSLHVNTFSSLSDSLSAIGIMVIGGNEKLILSRGCLDNRFVLLWCLCNDCNNNIAFTIFIPVNSGSLPSMDLSEGT